MHLNDGGTGFIAATNCISKLYDCISKLYERAACFMETPFEYAFASQSL